MNEMSLSTLYRRLTATPGQPVDAGRLVDAVSGTQADEAVAASLAKSAPLSALARLLGELQTESSELARSVNPARRAAHPAPSRETRRHAVGARRTPAPQRWLGALAACLAVALGVGLWHGHSERMWSEVDAQVASVPAVKHADRIFTTKDQIFASSGDARAARGRKHDELFRANFSGG